MPSIEMERPASNEQGSWREIGPRMPKWQEAFAALGLNALLSNVASAETSKLKGAELLRGRETAKALAWNTVNGLLPENRRAISQEDGTERIVVQGQVDPSMNLSEFVKKMDPNRDKQKANETFRVTAERIRQNIDNPDIENKLLVMLATESKEGALAIINALNEKEYSSNVFGEIGTAGDLMDLIESAGLDEFATAYEDRGDAKASQKFLTSIKYAVGVFVANGNPDDAPINLTEALKAQK